MRPVECTTSRLAPALDTIFGSLEVVRMGLDVGASDQAFQGAPINRGADIALGAAFATLFLSSAAYGYIVTERCSAATHGDAEAPESSSDSTAGPSRTTPAEAKGPRQAPSAATSRSQTAFDLRAAQAAVAAAFAEAGRTCSGSGQHVATLTYQSDGHVSNVVFVPPFEDKAAGRCVEKSTREASVPAFDGGEFVVRKRIDFSQAERNAKVTDAGAQTLADGGADP